MAGSCRLAALTLVGYRRYGLVIAPRLLRCARSVHSIACLTWPAQGSRPQRLVHLKLGSLRGQCGDTEGAGR